MKTEFKEGDLVYNPRTGTSIYRVEVNTDYYSDVYPLAIAHDPARGRFDTFTQDGKLFSSSDLPTIFKATKENRELLSKLYGVEFEDPLVKPTSREIIKALIARDGFCWCGTSDVAESHARADGALCLVKIVEVRSDFYSPDYAWEYAIPFNPITCEEITELPS